MPGLHAHASTSATSEHTELPPQDQERLLAAHVEGASGSFRCAYFAINGPPAAPGGTRPCALAVSRAPTSAKSRSLSDISSELGSLAAASSLSPMHKGGNRVSDSSGGGAAAYALDAGPVAVDPRLRPARLLTDVRRYVP
jgi:hypothetical protein